MKSYNRWNGKSRKARATKRNEAQKGAASTHSNEGVLNSTAAQQSSSRRRNIDPMWWTTALIGRKFNFLPNELKSTATKLACAKAVVESHKVLCPDMTRYFTWVLEQARRVRRTFDFQETCEALGVNPQYVAEHLVLLGKSRWQKVQLEGLAATISESEIRMYGVSRLVPEEYEFSPEATSKEASNE